MKKLFAAAVLITVLILGACPVCRSEDDRDLDRKVREIVSGVIQPGMSDYDKALALHDWLCSHAEYDYSLKNYDAEDILFDGTGVCQAYTEAYGLLLDAAGIPNAKASGTAGGGSHTWNMAKLGGRWYHIDCTWDDGAYRIGHIWFCLSDYSVSFDHTASSKPYAALSYELNYYYRNGSYAELTERFVNEIQTALDEGKTSFSLPYETIALDNVLGVDAIHYRTLCLILRDHAFDLNGGKAELSITYDHAINVAVEDDSLKVPIDAEHFPDANFRSYVSESLDTDGSGFLTVPEMNAVTNITLTGTAVTALRGLEYFPKLQSLNCDKTGLTELDVSRNPALTLISCNSNQLTGLDVSHNPELKELFCTQNSLTSLDVSANPKLRRLSCFWNPTMTELNVRGCAELTELQCSQSSLTELDVSDCLKLTYLSCYFNQLTSLDVTSNTALQSLYCNDNKRSITVEDSRFDLAGLPGFDTSRASDWTGGSVTGTVLTVDALGEITYQYDCGGGHIETFTLAAEGTLAGWPRIDAETFPDESFRAYVKEKCDTDGDGRLSDRERGSITEIRLSPIGTVEDLEGIALFPELDFLSVNRNRLVRLDVSANTKLTFLSCLNNVREITARDGVIDPEALGLDLSRISRIEGAEVKDGKLVLSSPGRVSYDYDCGGGFSAAFALDVRIPGDADRNGKSDFADAQLILQYESGWNVDMDENSADVNRDGYADLKDALLILQAFCGLDAELK